MPTSAAEAYATGTGTSSLDAHVAQHQLGACLVVELRGDVETLGLGKRVARYFTSSTVRLNDGSGCQPKNRPTYFYPCRFHLSDIVVIWSRSKWSKSISGTRSLLTIYKYKYLYYSGGF